MTGGAPERFDPNGSEDSEANGYAVLIWSGVAAFALFLAVVALTYGLPDKNSPEAERLLRADPMPTGSLDPQGGLQSSGIGGPGDFGPAPAPLDTPQDGALGGPAGLPTSEHKEIARLQVENAALRHTIDAMRNRVDMLTERLQKVEDQFGEFTGSVDRQAVRQSVPAPAPIPTPPPAAPAEPEAQTRTPYGIELGTYEDLATLKEGWRQLVQDDPDLFGGLSGLAGLRERNGRTELLLIAGPFPSATQASDYCGKVEQSGRFCLPAFYVGQTLAMR